MLTQQTKQLFDATTNFDLEKFQQALSDGADVNAFNDQGYTPLMHVVNTAELAVRSDDEMVHEYLYGSKGVIIRKMAKLLVWHKDIDINARSKVPLTKEEKKSYESKIYSDALKQVNRQYNPNYFTTRRDDAKEKGVLEERLKEINRIISLSPIPIDRGDTALHLYDTKDDKYYIGIVDILHAHPNVNFDLKNNIGDAYSDFLDIEEARSGRALLSAISRKDEGQAKRFLNFRININCFDKDRNTALHLAIINQLTSLIPLLLKYKIGELGIANVENNEGKTFLDLAQGNQEIEEAFNELLFTAIYHRDLEQVKFVIENLNLDVNVLKHGIKAIDHALHIGADSICEYLIEKGAIESGTLNDKDKEILGLEKGLQAQNKTILDLENNLQDEKTKISHLEKNSQDKNKRISDLEKHLQDEKTNVSSLRNFRNELEEKLKSEKNKVTNLKERNETNITKAKKAVASSIVGSVTLVLGIIMLSSYGFTLPYMTSTLFIISVLSFVCCVYNMYTMCNEKGLSDDSPSNLLNVSEVNSIGNNVREIPSNV